MDKKKKEKQPDCGVRVTTEKNDKKNGKKWEKPTLEDVSGRVMAQPYIRFT